MRGTRILVAVTVAAWITALSAPALAAVDARLVFFETATFSRGTTTITAFFNCIDPSTGSDVQTDATLSVTLTQGHRSVTQIEEFTCFGDDLVDITFRGFHPGTASVAGLLTACDQTDVCDTSTDTTEIAVTLA